MELRVPVLVQSIRTSKAAALRAMWVLKSSFISTVDAHKFRMNPALPSAF